jgi:uncharacterized phage protein (TIGR02218 family)
VSFLDDEGSVDASEPREFFDITMGATVYRLTSGTRDISIDGVLYKAEAMTRRSLGVPQLSRAGDQSLSVILRVNHPIVRRWYQQGVPPKTATVTAWRKQMRSQVVEQIWAGSIASIDCAGHVATITVASLLGPAFRRRLPTLTVGRQCGHVLYGAGCRLVKTEANQDDIPYKCQSTVIYVNGREVRFDLSTVPADYAFRSIWTQFGYLVHTSTGESMTIAQQDDLNPGVSTVTKVTLQAQIIGIKVGDSIDVFAGCAHDVITCLTKFANQVNFGGFPALPTRNPFFPTGLGVMEQV